MQLHESIEAAEVEFACPCGTWIPSAGPWRSISPSKPSSCATQVSVVPSMWYAVSSASWVAASCLAAIYSCGCCHGTCAGIVRTRLKPLEAIRYYTCCIVHHSSIEVSIELTIVLNICKQFVLQMSFSLAFCRTRTLDFRTFSSFGKAFGIQEFLLKNGRCVTLPWPLQRYSSAWCRMELLHSTGIEIPWGAGVKESQSATVGFGELCCQQPEEQQHFALCLLYWCSS